jgi:predicted PurR-regulated permease PerM
VAKFVATIQKYSSGPLVRSLDLGRIFNQNSILTAAKSFSEGALFILQGAYAGVLHFLFVMFIMFFSLFYMFIDGEKLVKRLVRLLPLQEKYDQMLIKDVNSIARATIKGTVLMAILQGVIISLIFWATGVPSPIFFGILLAVASVIPAVGSALVWLPVGIGMIVFGHLTEGSLIFLSGIFIVGTLDNFVRPRLVGKDTQMHPLLILFSTLGGIALFGLSGFIIGPIIVSLLVALWDIYVLEYKLKTE